MQKILPGKAKVVLKRMSHWVLCINKTQGVISDPNAAQGFDIKIIIYEDACLYDLPGCPGQSMQLRDTSFWNLWHP